MFCCIILSLLQQSSCDTLRFILLPRVESQAPSVPLWFGFWVLALTSTPSKTWGLTARPTSVADINNTDERKSLQPLSKAFPEEKSPFKFYCWYFYEWDAQTLLMCFGASQYRSFTGPKVRDKAASWRDKNYWLWLFFSRLRFRAIASILTKYLR